MPHDYNAPRSFNDSPIAKARMAKGMTQGALAEAIGVKKNQISAWETGAIPPSVNTLMKMSEVLGVEMSALVPERKNKVVYNIKEIRTAKGITQVQLAKMIGVSQSTFSTYETSAYEVPGDKLELIAEILGVTVEELISESDEGKNPITIYRKRKGMKQSELAEKAGLSVSSISNYEVGRFNPSREVLQRIADVLGVTVKELGGTDE